jgi:CsoR family transcriptional regulator, copper-sensing transcriptional repressor
MKAETKDNARKRIARVSGQVAGLDKMLQSDRSCSEILQQVVAVRSALDQLGILLLTEHLQTCVLHQDVHNAEDVCRDFPEVKRTEEIKAALTRFLK